MRLGWGIPPLHNHVQFAGPTRSQETLFQLCVIREIFGRSIPVLGLNSYVTNSPALDNPGSCPGADR